MSYKLSVILIGDMNVGKSHLLKVFADREQEVTSTLGIDFVHRELILHNQNVKVHIWDTAGQERFRAITQSYYRNIDCAIIVFDLTNRKSFDNIKFWLSDLQDKCLKAIPFIIVGQKKDLVDQRVITNAEACILSNEYQCHYFETSVSDPTSVQIAFYDVFLQAYHPQSGEPEISLSETQSGCGC